jgi:hypothetical protein
MHSALLGEQPIRTSTLAFRLCAANLSPSKPPGISAHCPVFNPKWTLWPLTNPRLHLKWFCGELKCTLVE